MALEHGMQCMGCEKKPARRDSHFHSDKCGIAFAKRSQGPVKCDECSAEAETVKEAKAKGWTKLSIDPEGLSHNYSGLCPRCKDEQER